MPLDASFNQRELEQTGIVGSVIEVLRALEDDPERRARCCPARHAVCATDARPAHPRRFAVRTRVHRLAPPARNPGHDGGTQPRMRGEHPVTADQVVPRAQHRRCESLREYLRRHHDVGRSVATGARQLQHDLAFGVAAQAFVGDSGERDVPAQPCELLAPIRAAAHPGMQAEPMRPGAQCRGIFPLSAGTACTRSSVWLARGAAARARRSRGRASWRHNSGR